MEENDSEVRITKAVVNWSDSLSSIDKGQVAWGVLCRASDDDNDDSNLLITFKHRLDKFWLNQEVIYNYKADLVGTGNRSIIN